MLTGAYYHTLSVQMTSRTPVLELKYYQEAVSIIEDKFNGKYSLVQDTINSGEACGWGFCSITGLSKMEHESNEDSFRIVSD